MESGSIIPSGLLIARAEGFGSIEIPTPSAFYICSIKFYIVPINPLYFCAKGVKKVLILIIQYLIYRYFFFQKIRIKIIAVDFFNTHF